MKREKKFDKTAYDTEYSRTHYDRVVVKPPKGTKDRWKRAAQAQGKSLNRFVIDCVESYIIRDDGKED